MRRRVQECLDQRIAHDQRVDRSLDAVRHVADTVAVGVVAAVLAPGVAAAVTRPAHASGEGTSERPDVREILRNAVARQRQAGRALKRQSHFVAGDHIAAEYGFVLRARRHRFGIDADPVRRDFVVLRDEIADVLEQDAVGGHPFPVLPDPISLQHQAVRHHQRRSQQVPGCLVVLEARILRVHRVQPVAAVRDDIPRHLHALREREIDPIAGVCDVIAGDAAVAQTPGVDRMPGTRAVALAGPNAVPLDDCPGGVANVDPEIDVDHLVRLDPVAVPRDFETRGLLGDFATAVAHRETAKHHIGAGNGHHAAAAAAIDRGAWFADNGYRTAHDNCTAIDGSRDDQRASARRGVDPGL